MTTDPRPNVERRLCPGSGMYVGLVVGHRDLCLDCGRRIKVAADYRLSEHSVPVDADGEPIKLKKSDDV